MNEAGHQEDVFKVNEDCSISPVVITVKKEIDKNCLDFSKP